MDFTKFDVIVIVKLFRAVELEQFVKLDAENVKTKELRPTARTWEFTTSDYLFKPTAIFITRSSCLIVWSKVLLLLFII